MRVDAQHKRRAILESATALFRSKGFDAVSMSDVAIAARVGAGTLYRHFPNKAALYGAIPWNRPGEVEAAAENALRHNGTAQRLSAWLKAHAELLIVNPGYATQLTGAFGRSDSPLAARCDAHLSAARRVIDALGPALRPDVDALTLCRLTGAVAMATEMVNLPLASVEELLDVVAAGLLAKPLETAARVS